MHNERLLIKAWHSLEDLQKSPHLLFFRAKGWELIGILTKIENKLDGSWGVMRRVALGFTFTGEKIEEYLDRKNQRTGELEDLIQIQTDMIVVTARNSSSPDDEDEDNFQYIMNPFQSNEIKDQLDQLVEYRRIIRNVEKKLDETTRMRESYKSQAEMAESEASSLREKVSTFADKLGQARAQAEYYRTQNKRDQIKLLEIEGFLKQQYHNASHIGELKGMDSSEVVLDRAQKEYKIKQELDKLGMGENNLTLEDLNQFEKQLLSKIEQKMIPVQQKPVEKKHKQVTEPYYEEESDGQPPIV